jgi:hypothetical protein
LANSYEPFAQWFGSAPAAGPARLLPNYRAISGKTRVESLWLTRPQFARYYLMRLGIGDELKRVALNPQLPYRLASVEEVLALRPELRPPE